MRVSLVLLAGLVLLLGGCGNSPQYDEALLFAGKIGQQCTVQFRRGDALGAGGGLPVPPTTSAINSAEVYVSGKLKAIAGSWIKIEVEGKEFLIPREVILLLQFSK
ncbi:MAG TPA: hypothetical protein PKA06_05190 [Gemmatales bacterium]|nr:hypothetical protein [Gemmatales bacterium]HMP17525.1 hypothetical protein [Gemmatales bacterium]